MQSIGSIQDFRLVVTERVHRSHAIHIDKYEIIGTVTRRDASRRFGEDDRAVATGGAREGGEGVNGRASVGANVKTGICDLVGAGG